VETWFQHAKPKRRQALNKWNKETGGGSGEVHDFIDFCNNDRWLAWMFALDCDTSFLLAASACGQMPAHLQLESGHNDDLVSELGAEDGTARTSSSKSAEKLLAKNKEDVGQLNRLAAQFAQSQTKNQSIPDAPEKPSFHFCMERAAHHREEIKNVEGDGSLSPDTKELTLTMLKRKKKALCKLAEEADAKRHKTGGNDCND